MSSKKSLNTLFLVLGLNVASTLGLSAQGSLLGGFVELEAGAAFTGNKNLRIPADTGSDISLRSDIASDPALALRLGYRVLGGGVYTFALFHYAVLGCAVSCQALLGAGPAWQRGPLRDRVRARKEHG